LNIAAPLSQILSYWSKTRT